MPAIVVQTTINAPPEKVRATFLDFEVLPARKNKFLHSVAVTRPNSKVPQPAHLAEPGWTAHMDSALGHHKPTISSNTPEQLSWAAKVSGIKTQHTFEFLDGPGSEGTKTLFRQTETYNGAMSFVFWPGSPLRWYVKGLFKSLNLDLKRWSEESSAPVNKQSEESADAEGELAKI